MKNFKMYEVYEDNAGGLNLYVVDTGTGKIIFAHCGYEYEDGWLSEDLDALESGSDPAWWDGNQKDEMPAYPYMTLEERREADVELVANWFNGDESGLIYPCCMGAAAKREFCVPWELESETNVSRINGWKASEEEVVAWAIRSIDYWIEELCAQLCDLAGLLEEYEDPDSDGESVVFRAADRLNVAII